MFHPRRAQDLSAPKLPFVIGVLGVGGETTGDNTEAFRKSMAAPAAMEEFKGTVANVFTATYWPTELDAVLAKANPIENEFGKNEKQLKEQNLSGADRSKALAKLNDEKQAALAKVLTKDELFLLDNGISNQGFHYYGSAKFFGQIGKAFAEALVDLRKQ